MRKADEVIRQYVSDTVSFAVSTYKHLQRTSSSNFISSPLSMETLLILLRLGAKGLTSNEIASNLRQSSDQAKIEPAVKALISILTQGGFYTFFLANKLYVKKGCAVKADFRRVAEEIFSAYVESMDFNNPTAAAHRINAWVRNHTMGNIGDLIVPEQLSSTSSLVLINTLYVNAMWEMKFTKEAKKKFYTSEDKTEEMEYMLSRGRYRYCRIDNKATIIEIKFVSDEGAMFIVLPNARTGLAEVEKMIDRILNITTSTFMEDCVQLELPDFKISTILDFKNVLEECGVKKLFRRSEADLSGIAGERRDLHVNTIVQKVLLRVDQRGIEATHRNTAGWDKKSSDIPANAEVIKFIVDHPFMFYIKLEDVVIFVGRVVNPTLGEPDTPS